MSRKQIRFIIDGKEQCKSVIRLAEGTPDYWTFQDVSHLKGKKIVIDYDGSHDALSKIIQADTIVAGYDIYCEAERPIYHFTTRRGWINDPNGCIYHDGVYHMFYQHNPFERDWENMHWGHAISNDMMHWKEMPDAIHPDSLGTIFSGSAVIDYGNDAKLERISDEPNMLVFYTSDNSKYELQCMAYSMDGGKSFIKYSKNPVIDSHKIWNSHDTRDPKVFWYAPGNHWVMVLNERDGHTIYNSSNLIDWIQQSHVTGFWECPELFELKVDGQEDKRKWVMWGASGTYMVGDFNGKVFTPTTNKQCNMGGSGYAAQCINNIPQDDGRVIKMTWGKIQFNNSSFNGVMLLPQQQTLHSSLSGIRLFGYPVKEVFDNFSKIDSCRNISLSQANNMLRKYSKDDKLYIRATLHFMYSTDTGISLNGERIFNYDMNYNKVNGMFYSPMEPCSMDVTADIFIDGYVVELFIDNGAYSCSFKRNVNSDNEKGYEIWGNDVRVKKLDIFKPESIWNN